MIREFEKFHGIALRDVVNSLECGVHIVPFDFHGIINSYLVNRNHGVYLKHSSRRLSPWTFSFSIDHLRELLTLREAAENVWIIFICGSDGLACVPIDEFLGITGARSGGVASLRIERHRNKSYRVHGNEGTLEHAVVRGIGRLAQALKN